jgi:hypothetical protein
MLSTVAPLLGDGFGTRFRVLGDAGSGRCVTVAG